MARIKKKYETQSIILTNYVDANSGEYLESSHPDILSVNMVNNNLVVFDYKRYFIVSDEALDYIASMFNDADLGKISKMTRMIEGEYNMLMNKAKKPHVKETLREELDYSISKFREFLNKLFRNGIIAYVISNVGGRTQTYILLNPHLARKRKSIHVETTKFFDKYPLKIEEPKSSKKNNTSSASLKELPH